MSRQTPGSTTGTASARGRVAEGDGHDLGCLAKPRKTASDRARDSLVRARILDDLEPRIVGQVERWSGSRNHPHPVERRRQHRLADPPHPTAGAPARGSASPSFSAAFKRSSDALFKSVSRRPWRGSLGKYPATTAATMTSFVTSLAGAAFANRFTPSTL